MISNEKQIKINQIGKTLGSALTKSGLTTLKGSYRDLERIVFPFGKLDEALKSAGLVIPITQLDFNYYFASWQNWEKMLELLYNMLKDFKWEKEFFDCDNRAHLVSSLCALIFGLSTCGQGYCQITNTITGNKSYHWANLIVGWDNRVYLFDMDNGGLTMEIQSGKPITMGKWAYEFKSARFF